MLERSGFEVLLAENGKEGVELFESFADRITLVLLDLAMPVVSGDRALDGIRAISQDVPVLVMTGYSESEAVARFAGKGATGFITKPFTRTQLLDAIERATGMRSGEPVAAQ
jgi:CheY-like chemotaxis protein